MPKELEERLMREADEKGLSGEHKQAYVYGTINKIKKERAEKIKELARKQREKREAKEISPEKRETAPYKLTLYNNLGIGSDQHTYHFASKSAALKKMRDSGWDNYKAVLNGETFHRDVKGNRNWRGYH